MGTHRCEEYTDLLETVDTLRRFRRVVERGGLIDDAARVRALETDRQLCDRVRGGVRRLPIHNSDARALVTAAEAIVGGRDSGPSTSFAADHARLEFIEAQTNGEGWIARQAMNGRGFRLQNVAAGGFRTAREALDALRTAP